MIRLEGIEKTYHVGEVDLPVLRGISLEIAQGEYAALMGVSGSGKSTLMNIIGCLDRPTSGAYWLDGEEVSLLSEDELARIRNKKLGFVFQNFNLLSRTSALENVMLPLMYSEPELIEREAARRAEEMLVRVGLAERMKHHPAQLSGGQQQRVAIARALVNNPPFLLADEPTGNLDSKMSAEIIALFSELNERDGITVLLVTHDADVAHNAGRVIHIRDGRIDADTAEKKEPRSPGAAQ